MADLIVPAHATLRYARVRDLLERLDIFTPQVAAVLMVLSDDNSENDIFPTLREAGKPLSYSARTEQIFRHAAPMLGLAEGRKVDREQRDYAIVPLREVGLVEKAYVLPAKEAAEKGELIVRGRHKTKSPSNAYVLTEEGRRLLLEVPDADWDAERDAWLAQDEQRRLRLLQQKSADLAVSSEHRDLIRASIEALQSNVCRGYEAVYIDDADGDRIPAEVEERLETLNLLPDLDSRFPDGILTLVGERKVWFIDAVTSDGEIDEVRRRELDAWAERRGWRVAGMTTTYPSWKIASGRQGKHKNLAAGTTIWIAQDGGKLFRVESLAG